MRLLLDTSTPVCRVWLYDEQTLLLSDEWQADRQLAEGIFSYLESVMGQLQLGWKDIDGLGIYKGPGSFTGLRIGAAVLNTLAADRQIPIVGTSGENWLSDAIHRLDRGDNEHIILPDYGRPARITAPRK